MLSPRSAHAGFIEKTGMPSVNENTLSASEVEAELFRSAEAAERQALPPRWAAAIPQILDQSAYRELREPPAALHAAARAALSANESGDRKGALEGLERFVGAAKQVVSFLDAIGGELDRASGVAQYTLGTAISK